MIVSLAVKIIAVPAELTAIEVAVGAVLSILIVASTAVDKFPAKSAAYKLYSPSLCHPIVIVVFEFADVTEDEILVFVLAAVMLARFVTVTAWLTR